MQVLAEAASREAELQPRSSKHQQLARRLGASITRVHTLNKTQVPVVNQLTTSKQNFDDQKMVSQQSHLNHKIQQDTSNAVQGHLQQTFKQLQTKFPKQTSKQTVVNANVLKTSSLPNIPNISKFPVNSNLILTAKQQQTTIANAQQVQKNQNPVNTKIHQQHLLLKVGSSNKSQPQHLQSDIIKSSTTKIVSTVKSLNQHQPGIQRNHPNIQAMPITQQQQNIINSQNTLKQSGCIKTLIPQKQTQRNHSNEKVGIKTSLNTNMSTMKVTTSSQVIPLNIPTNNSIQQKNNIKTLLPQQGGGIAITGGLSGGVQSKTSTQPIRLQQQTIQQKQFLVTGSISTHYTQTPRSQPGQIKTLLPVGVHEARTENDIKIEIKNEIKQEKEEQNDGDLPQSAPTQILQSPQKIMPLPYECLQFVLQDHNYGAPPPRTPPPQSPPPHPKQQSANGAGNSYVTTQHPYVFNPAINDKPMEDDATSAISSEVGREVEPEGEETETAPEGEGDDEDSVTRCICDFEHDDGYMICCDRCLVWQHVDCMGIDRTNIPDEYLCEVCRPRRIDRARARALQMRKREELLNSDTSSDSSTSSADTDVDQNITTKNRKISAQQSISRRKSDPPQLRRLNNNNNVTKRQRRDTHPRQANTVRSKKESNAVITTVTNPVTKQKGPPKRKIKRRTSLDDKEEETSDAWGSNMAPLRQWIERYEEAVTNHYSPELRARISSIKINGMHNDLRQSNIGAAATGKCRLNIQSNNVRFLVASMHLPPNTPVVELRGKYMLSTQHRPSYLQGRQHMQRPGPFVFFYRLPRDGTEVCVDTRTYGNDARFIRRSCKPNAEIKHCIEKGTLHLYIVTNVVIEKNTEITIRHDQHDIVLSPNSNSSNIPIMCACNSLKDCHITSLATSSMNKRGSNGSLLESADVRERRRRGKRNVVNEDVNEISATNFSAVAIMTDTVTPSLLSTPIATQPSPKKIINNNATTTTTTTIVKDSPSISSISNTNNTSSNVNNTPAFISQTVKEEQALPAQQTQSGAATNHSINKIGTASTILSVTAPQTVNAEVKKDKKKMTREERKMEAIMKAFERLEKAEQRKQEVQARNAQRKESGGLQSDNEDSSGHAPSKSKQINTDKIPRRKRRKGRTRSDTTPQSQSTRRTRLNSAESDLTSGDESNSMQSPPFSNQNCSYSLRIHPIKEINNVNDDGDQIQTDSQTGIPTAAGLLLALANSNAPISPPQQQPTPIKSPTCDSGASTSSQSSTPSTPLSSACLLVAAAVGPLAPGFKFPKTKKLLMNEWLKETPELSTQTGETRTFGYGVEQSSDFLSQNYTSKSLATLVQAADSVSGICESMPQRCKQIVSPSVLTGSAKKRWLRQAISEECDSPNSSRPESPPSEMVAPPKKRRIARESLSSDNYTPPSTPTMQQDHMPIHRGSINEDDFIEQLQSPINEDLGSQTEYDSDQVKDEIQSKFSNEMKRKCKISSVSIDSSFIKGEKESILSVKIKEESKSEDEEISLDDVKNCIKIEKKYIKDEYKVLEVQPSLKIKTEPNFSTSGTSNVLKKSVKIEEEIQTGTVEIVDQNEQDIETDDLSSPIAIMESDTDLKQRVAELRLEFGGDITGLTILNSDLEKSFQDQSDFVPIKCEENRYDDNTSIDEFDVEAQMKKITGDDGDDYKKMENNLERDKSMDGIEGLMESSKEDSESDSEERNINDFKETNKTFESTCAKINATNTEVRVFKEFEYKNELLTEEKIQAERQNSIEKKSEAQIKYENLTYKESLDSIEKELEYSKNIIHKIKQYKVHESTMQNYTSSSIVTVEESMMELDSMELPSEDISQEPVKIFSSIPPLSERIRKKVDSSPGSKSRLDIKASIIESSLDLEIVKDSKNDEKEKMFSTALQELLEAKIELENESKIEIINKNQIKNKISSNTEISSTQELDKKECIVLSSTVNQRVDKETPLVKEEESFIFQYKRLKDPRTVVPNKMLHPSPCKKDGPVPVKRKLSISEYRKRKQQSTGTPPEPENSEVLTEGKVVERIRSNSASSSTSSLSSDDESVSKSVLEIPSLSTLPIFVNSDNDEKKVGTDEGTIGWSAAPTLVERQRENLTERLKREFGLFLNDDDEERSRKQVLNNSESLVKSTNNIVSSATDATEAGCIGVVSYPVAQLPPQPYIPPPGSASIHYSHYPQVKPTSVSQVVPYQGYSVQLSTPVNNASGYSSNLKTSTTVSSQQYAVTQAPPGANPYPPGPAVPVLMSVPTTVPPPVPPPTTASVPVAHYSPGIIQTAIPTVVVYPLPPPQPHKSFYNNSTSRS